MNPPTITTVIPCRGHQHFLLRCLASVAPQCVGGDSIIVVLDGEPLDAIVKADLSNLCYTFDTPFRLIELPERQGVSAARNAGLAEAQGDWLKFLDADDLTAPYSFAALRGLALPETMHVVGGLQAIISSGSFTHHVLPDFRHIAFRNPLLLSNAFIRRRAAEDVGAFDSRIEFEEDWDFWLRIRRRYGDSAFGALKVPFCYYWIDAAERAAKTRNHTVEGMDVRAWLAKTHGITPL